MCWFQGIGSTMTTESAIRIGQIRRVHFKYEDNPTIAKPRPAIVIAVDPHKGKVTLVKVTSHGPRKECHGEVTLLNWAADGLEHKSTARCSKQIDLDISTVTRSPLVGTLAEADLYAVRLALMSMKRTNKASTCEPEAS